MVFETHISHGGLAQVVERSICIREAPGSIPGFSSFQNKITFLDITTVLEKSDILFVTLPLTKETHNLISSKNIAYLNRGAYLINVSRAQIINKESLYKSLTTGKILGAALDVWYDDAYEKDGKKYPSKEYPFHELNNVVLSPYRAGYVMKSSPHLKAAIENLLSFARDGKLKYKVNFEKGYKATEKLKKLLPDNFSLTDLALKWILMHDEVSVVIPGATNKSQVQMNTHATDLEDISSLLPKINSIYDELIKPDVHNRW